MSKSNEVALVLDNMALVLVIFDHNLSIRSPCVPEAALAAKLSERYRSQSLRFVRSSLADICFVSSCCWDFLALRRMWNFVSTDLRRTIIWRGPFLLELGLPTLWVYPCCWRCFKNFGFCVFPLGLSNARKMYERAPSILLQFVQLLSEVVIVGLQFVYSCVKGAIFSSMIFENSFLSESFTTSLIASAIFLISSVETSMGATT